MVGLIVHEWLEPRGGAERVVDAMRLAFPDADLYALWNDDVERNADTMESWLSKTPLRNHKALALPFEPMTWRTIRPYQKHEHHDWILVSSHLFAHHVRPLGNDAPAPKYVYAHTPARYIWVPDLDTRGDNLVARAGAMLLRPLDRKRANEAISIAANSHYVRERILRSWGCDARVIYPPVNIDELQSEEDWYAHLDDAELATVESLPSRFVFGASRFVRYKRLDWVIRAGAMNRIPVVIAGRGPEERNLRALANELDTPAKFVIDPSDQLLNVLYREAEAYVFPAIEDFGIMPVEAQALGTPVVVTAVGGALETVVPGQSGWIADEDTVEALSDALAQLLAHMPSQSEVMSAVHRFGARRFQQEIRNWIE